MSILLHRSNSNIMTKFIVSYLAPIDATWKKAESSPEDMEKGMEAWMKWAEKCGHKLVDMGSPLGNGITISPGGSSVNSESKIIGYSILQADNMEDARELLKEHPHLDWNASCQIELHEALPAHGI